MTDHFLDDMDSLPEQTFFADGERTPTVGFDWLSVETALGEVESSDFSKAADCLAFMMGWVLAAPTAHARFVRFVAMASGLHPDKWPTMQKLEGEIGCSKQNLSRASKQAERLFGLHFIRSKPTTACEKMSRRRKGGPNRTKAAGKAAMPEATKTADSDADAPEASQAPAIGLPTAPLNGSFSARRKKGGDRQCHPFLATDFLNAFPFHEIRPSNL